MLALNSEVLLLCSAGTLYRVSWGSWALLPPVSHCPRVSGSPRVCLSKSDPPNAPGPRDYTEWSGTSHRGSAHGRDALRKAFGSKRRACRASGRLWGGGNAGLSPQGTLEGSVWMSAT